MKKDRERMEIKAEGGDHRGKTRQLPQGTHTFCSLPVVFQIMLFPVR